MKNTKTPPSKVKCSHCKPAFNSNNSVIKEHKKTYRWYNKDIFSKNKNEHRYKTTHCPYCDKQHKVPRVTKADLFTLLLVGIGLFLIRFSDEYKLMSLPIFAVAFVYSYKKNPKFKNDLLSTEMATWRKKGLFSTVILVSLFTLFFIYNQTQTNWQSGLRQFFIGIALVQVISQISIAWYILKSKVPQYLIVSFYTMVVIFILAFCFSIIFLNIIIEIQHKQTNTASVSHKNTNQKYSKQ